MIKISNILDEECIKLEMTASKKKDAVDELLEMLKSAGKINHIDKDELLRDMLSREKVSSTGIGDGIAIPHKLITGLENTIIAFGRKRSGINFDSIDGRPASLFFLILGKEGSSANHLRLLSKLARLLHNPDFRETLSTAQTPLEVINAVKKQEEE